MTMPTKRKKRSRTTRRAARKTKRRAPSQEAIRRRAYEIYMQRRGHPGTPDHDWAQAEHELAHAA